MMRPMPPVGCAACGRRRCDVLRPFSMVPITLRCFRCRVSDAWPPLLEGIAGWDKFLTVKPFSHTIPDPPNAFRHN